MKIIRKISLIIQRLIYGKIRVIAFSYLTILRFRDILKLIWLLEIEAQKVLILKLILNIVQLKILKIKILFLKKKKLNNLLPVYVQI